jgi:hypothetical protein
MVSVVRRQLAEIESLVVTRQRKLEDLREVIRLSHGEVTSCKQTMSSQEARCKTLGHQLYGAEYVLPLEGAEKIRHISSLVASCLSLIFMVYFSRSAEA